MPGALTKRIQELHREIERQDEQWAQVERQLRELSHLGIAVSRRVVDDIDDAFGVSARAGLSPHHPIC